jgi:hypothetical protein
MIDTQPDDLREMRPMRMRFLTAAILISVIGSPARASEVEGPVATQLIALEKSTWRYYQLKDDRSLSRLTDPNFADLYDDGTVVDRTRWLSDMHAVDMLGSDLSKFHVFKISEQSFVVTYEARARAHTRSGDFETHTAVTSTWVRQKGRWLNTFYEEIPLEAAKRVS